MLNQNYAQLVTYAIIVTYNGSYWIEKCISSLEESSVAINVIVVDNCSTDNTVELIKNSFPNVLIVESDSNLGFGKANNLGIAKAYHAGADYVFLLNQDAWVFPNAVEELIKVQRSNPEYYVLSPIHLDGKGKNLDFSFSTYISPYRCDGFISDMVLKKPAIKAVYPLSFVNAAFWLLSRESITKVGGFDPIFPHYGEDDDYLQRVHFHSGKVGICPLSFGCHDRDQTPVNIAKFPLEKRYKRQIVVSLILLMNINQSFFHCFMVFTRARMDAFFAEFFKLQVKESFLELKVSFYILSMILHIKRRRSENKKEASQMKLNILN
jgi:GT2 family glycosyltransferase